MKNLRIVLLVSSLMLALLLASAYADEAVFRPEDLPVVYLQIDGGQKEIDLMNGSSDHSYRCTGTMDIVVPDGYSGEFEGRYPQESVYGLNMKYIRGRGNGTWGMGKNPYKIKLEEKQNLFGMGKRKTWVLLADFFDNSLIRNWLTEWLGNRMGLEYTPEGVFVEVVMNSDYLGSYYLCEQVEVGKNRVAIDELTEQDVDLPAIRGGYLLEFSPDDVESPDAFETARGLMLGNAEPSFSTDDDGYRNDAQMNYIRNFIRQAETAIFAEDGLAESGRGYSEYLDLQSMADYWWIMEFTVNGDAFRTDSAHMFKKRSEPDGSEGKLHFGPLWDFDESWGNAQIKTVENIGFNNSTFIWMDELRKKPEFRALLEERWLVLDAELEEIVRDGGILDQIAPIVRGSWYRDRERWHDTIVEYSLDIGRTFDEEIEHIRHWTVLRREWIRRNMDRLGLLTFTLTVRGEGMEEQKYDIACDTSVDIFDLEAPEIEGREFVGWMLEDGTMVDCFLLMDRDMILTAQFN